MKGFKISLIFFWVWISFPQPAMACVPMFFLLHYFATPIYTTGSMLALLGIITFKSLFFIVFEKRFRWHHAFLLMVMANLFSTCIGLGLTILNIFPFLSILVIPFVYWLSVTQAKRLIHNHPGGYFKGWNAHVIANIVLGLCLGTHVLFAAAENTWHESLAWFWVWKFFSMYSALVVSIGLTTLWEEWTVQKLSDVSCYSSVLKVNLAASFVIFGYAAILILPDRMQSSNFLVQLFIQ